MWEQIRSNQRRSVILILVMGALLILLGYLIGQFIFKNGAAGIGLAFIVWVIMTLIAYYKGDSILLSFAMARKIGRDDHSRLYNIVEEMKIASGLEYMPEIYIINDPALNAFATGRDPEHTTVVVTSGLLKQLKRDELQGVIGHEIAHIKNQDVLLMVIAGILLGSMEFLAWRGPVKYMQFSAEMRRRSSFGGMYGHRELSEEESKVVFMIVGIFMFPLILLMPLLARMVYFAISRNREYLADASSALYTRYPEGLASALETIARSPSQIMSASKSTAPMYIVNPYRRGISMTDLTRTHPPISERIQILRSMGGVSYHNYNESYMEIHRGSKGIIPASGLVGGGMPVVKTRLAGKTDDPGRLQRVRETSEVVWKTSNYTSMTCGCGVKLRIPPGFKGSSITCPRCRMRHPLTHGR